MFSRLSIHELAAIALLLDEDDELQTLCRRKNGETPNENTSNIRKSVPRIKKRRRLKMRDNLRQRKQLGEYWTLYPSLADNEDKFFKYFNMSQYHFNIILEKIKHSIRKEDTIFREAIGPREKLAVCLRFLVTGYSYRATANKFCLGYSTVSYIVIEVCNAIISNLLSEYMPLPDRERWLSIAEDFWNTRNFPNCVGVIDGKYMTISSPSRNKNTDMESYMKIFSVVIMTIVDARSKFIMVDIGLYGDGDRGIFDNSKLGKDLAIGKMKLPEGKPFPDTDVMMPHVLLGSTAFILKNYLLRSFSEKKLDNPAKIYFNNKLSQTRSVSENAFASLMQKFAIYNTKITLLPGNIDKLILATCILHNLIYSEQSCDVPRVTLKTHLKNLPPSKGSSANAALNVRDSFMSYLYEHINEA